MPTPYIGNIVFNYENLTSVIKPSSGGTKFNTSYKKVYNPYGNYFDLNNSVTLYNKSVPHQIIFSFNNPVNLQNFTYLTFEFNYSGSKQLLNYFENGNLTIGLDDGTFAGWYTIAPSCQEICYIKTTNNTVNVSVLIGQEPRLYQTDTYNSSHIDYFIFKLNNETYSGNLTLTYPQLYGVSNISIRNTWVNSVMRDNISYILVDNSLVSGTTENYSHLSKTIGYLTNSSEIRLVYSTYYLKLYKII